MSITFQAANKSAPSTDAETKSHESWLGNSFGRSLRAAVAAVALAESSDVAKAGYTDINVPDSVYKENGTRCIGPYRPKADGSPGFDGGLVSVTMIQRDPTTGAQVRRNVFSGVILDNYHVLTAAHGAIFAVQNPTTVTTTIDWTTNCLVTNPNAIQALEVTMYPGWTKETAYNTPDMAIIKLKRPIVEGGMLAQPTFITSQPGPGAVVTLGGYGVSGYSNETKFDDGHPRAGNGLRDKDDWVFGYDPKLYFSVDSDPVFETAQPAFVGAGGDSGGIAIQHSERAIAGILVASTRTMPGWTVALDISAPPVQDFIKKIVKPVVPNDFTITRNSDSVTLRWPSEYRGLVLLKSTDLSSWTEVNLPRIVQNDWVTVTVPKQGDDRRGFFKLVYQP